MGSLRTLKSEKRDRAYKPYRMKAGQFYLILRDEFDPRDNERFLSTLDTLALDLLRALQPFIRRGQGRTRSLILIMPSGKRYVEIWRYTGGRQDSMFLWDMNEEGLTQRFAKEDMQKEVRRMQDRIKALLPAPLAK